MPFRTSLPSALVAAVLVLALTSCDRVPSLESALNALPWHSDSAAERYESGLNQELQAVWRSQAEQATAQALPVTGQAYAELGHFSAAAFEFSLQAGESARIQVADLTATAGLETANQNSGESPRFFATLQQQDGADWELLTEIDPAGPAHQFETDRNHTYRLLIQPRLDINASYRLELSKGGSLPMPVAGATAASFGGGFGVPRDGGRRVHQGIDIFAPRGTELYAVSDGWVSTGDTSRGGLVVWLRPGLQAVSYYYAHLDSIAVSSGQRVKQGDLLGTVGDTGNARGTPPHLHFGIYRRMHGAVDPLPYLRPPPQSSFDLPDSQLTAAAHQVRASSLNLRATPSDQGEIVGRLPQGSSVQLTALARAPWVRVSTEDGLTGYVDKRWLEPAEDLPQEG